MAVGLSASAPAMPVALPFTPPLARNLTPAPAATPFTQELESQWSALDYNHTNSITPQEVWTDMQNPAFTGNAAAAVATLGDIQATDPGLVLTHYDVNAYAYVYNAGTFQTWDGMYSANQSNVNNEVTSLYGAAGVPQWSAMSQGGYVGDCYFQSAVGGMVFRNPHTIMRMIVANPDGTYTVTFPGQSPLTVKAPTEAEMARYAKANGTWLPVLEKAYGAKVDQQQWPWQRTVEPYQAEANGGEPAHGIAAMTGHKVSTVHTADLTLQQLDQTLRDALQNGRLVTATNMPHKAIDGIPGNHSLAVLDYDSQTQTVTLWNPWGWQPANAHLTNVGNGEFTISLHDLAHSVTQLDIEQAS